MPPCIFKWQCMACLFVIAKDIDAGVAFSVFPFLLKFKRGFVAVLFESGKGLNLRGYIQIRDFRNACCDR